MFSLCNCIGTDSNTSIKGISFCTGNIYNFTVYVFFNLNKIINMIYWAVALTSDIFILILYCSILNSIVIICSFNSIFIYFYKTPTFSFTLFIVGYFSFNFIIITYLFSINITFI